MNDNFDNGKDSGEDTGAFGRDDSEGREESVFYSSSEGEWKNGHTAPPPEDRPPADGFAGTEDWQQRYYGQRPTQGDEQQDSGEDAGKEQGIQPEQPKAAKPVQEPDAVGGRVFYSSEQGEWKGAPHQPGEEPPRSDEAADRPPLWNEPNGSVQNGPDNTPYPQDPASEYKWSFQEYDSVKRESPEHPPKSRNKGLAVFTVIFSSLVIVSLCVFVGARMFGVFQSGPGGGQNTNSMPAGSLTIVNRPDEKEAPTTTGGKLTTQEIAKKVKPSVVGVVQYQRMQSLGPSASGSGVIMASDGYIVTNAHVVDGADSIKVVLNNGEEYEASLIGIDTKTDLAVIKISTTNLTPAEFGNSKQVEDGEPVVAIGNPGGIELAGSVTQGIVSAAEREVESSNGGYRMKCIQTDAAINPGNSGGALINQYGQVIGINSSKIAATDYEGIGFAIAMTEAKPIIDDLMNYGYVKDRVKIGISYTEVDAILAKLNGIPAGIYVEAVEQDSDAYAKGIRQGDIITHINGKEIASSDVITEELKNFKPGQTVTLTVFRSTVNGQTRTYEQSVVLSEDKGNASAIVGQGEALPK